MSRRSIWSPRFAVLGVLIAVALILGLRTRARDGRMFASAKAARLRLPEPLATGDADRDGLADTREAELAARFAPVVVLDPKDENRPASIEWLLARLPSGRGLETEEDGFSEAIRAGSRDPRDWVTYVHAYQRADGGVNLQYWFFYPYNNAPLFFDHEGDWEHITVELTVDGVPAAAAFAQHGNNNPGVVRAWSEVRKLGDHPIVLSARGTHASYADQASLAWFESASQCDTLDRCADPIWRTWEGGGLMNMGERGAPLGAPAALAHPGRWGGLGTFLRSRDAIRGPMQQGAFWAGAQ